MRIKGRRQSSNIVDLSDPKEMAKHQLRMDRFEPDTADIRMHANQRISSRIQDTFGRNADVVGMEMLLGDRWKD